MQDGVAVVPLLDRTMTMEYRQRLQNMTCPEFMDHTGVKVMGGFGAHGHASSFHHEDVRQLRLQTQKPSESFLWTSLGKKSFFVERLFDRVCIRPQGSSTTRESWHRDLNPMTMLPNHDKDKTFSPKPNDHVIGGWLNLDDEPQFFSCALRTHHDVIKVKKRVSGFTVTSSDKENRPKAVRVEIPSGHGVFFFQNLLHQVLPMRQKKDSVRVFHAWRVVFTETTPAPFFPKEWTDQWIMDQAVPRLPSGQHPPMYSSNHTSVYLFRGNHHDPIEFSKKLHPACLAEKTCKSGKNKGRSYQIVERFMSSLRAYQLPMHRPYSQEEKDMFSPRRMISGSHHV